MTNKFVISDTHFNHRNILTFRHGDENGPLIRPGFVNVEEMNERMIDNWNKVVKPQDKVYHLGDVALGNVNDFHNIMRRLNGHKRLIQGNHDDKFGILEYASHFEYIVSSKPFGGKQYPFPFFLCHYPLHEDSLYKRGGIVYNVHGHIHEREVMLGNRPDSRYINVCVEKIDYTPMHFDELYDIMRKRTSDGF